MLDRHLDPVKVAIAWSLFDDFNCPVEEAVRVLKLPVGLHAGDCTSEAYSCHACFVEDVDRLADDAKRVAKGQGT